MASPPKQLFISRLAFTTSMDEELEYIKNKVGLFSPFSFVKLTKDSNHSGNFTYRHQFNLLGNPSS